MKRKLKQAFSLLFVMVWAVSATAHIDDPKNDQERRQRQAQFRADCAVPIGRTDMAINNVRTKLLSTGEIGYDGQSLLGQYIVPNVDPASGYPEVSAIYASALWLGGFDPAGNLKIAAQTYGIAYGYTDYYTGPIPEDGTAPSAESCENWDRIFKVNGDSIRKHLDLYQDAEKNGVNYNPDLIPEAVKAWPARGNPFFESIYGFALPNTLQGLAPFFDRDGDELYDPQKGDYPRVQLRGCDAPTIPDEMNFHIFNDAGGPHVNTRGEALQMEVHALSFAYQTVDILNNTTFQQYRLINRGVESLDSMHIGYWVDPDLGCNTDDLVGCAPEQNLAYIYNEDALDGNMGEDCICLGNESYGYCDHIPMVSLNLLQGPIDENGEELGMSSFTYYLTGAIDYPDALTDPNTAQDHYNFLTGSWKDGTPFTYGGSGYSLGGLEPWPYAFSDSPNDPTGWSLCTENFLPIGQRLIQTFGAFRMEPGARQEILKGIVWLPDIPHPCPDITPLLRTDDYLKKIFDNCIEFTDGPDAPDVDWVELDREAIAVLTNDETRSNNAFESYAELDICAPVDYSQEERLYQFEGYKIYQLADPEVSIAELDDPERARLAYQGDLENEVTDIYNWTPSPNPDPNPYTVPAVWSPTLMVEGANEGIQHAVRFTEDLFAEGDDKRLINHRRYYYMAIAYAHNNYEAFSQYEIRFPTGQHTTYQQGLRNIKVYTVIPRPNKDIRINSQFGDSIAITRLSGKGNNGFILDIDSETRAALFNNLTEGQIPYKKGTGPFEVSVYNPLGLKAGTYQLQLLDETTNEAQLSDSAHWELTHLASGEQIRSRRMMGQANEQVLAEFGLSINLKQPDEPGNIANNNGLVTFDLSYEDAQSPWLQAFPEGNLGFNFLKTAIQEPDNSLDPNQAFQQLTNGFFTPYFLCDYQVDFNGLIVSPAWGNSNWGRFIRQRSGLDRLNNVDIVLTSNKDLWSRCVIVEAASTFYTSNNTYPAEGEVTAFAPRAAPSVGKEDANGDGLPDPDGDGTGMGWFPGYAIDVETGQRLNLFFGENSTYDGQLFPEAYDRPGFGGKQLGNDMMWNPAAQLYLGVNTEDIYDMLGGGQQFIYVMDQSYDACAEIREQLEEVPNRHLALTQVTWVGTLLPTVSSQYLPYSQGLIPNDVLIKLRVQSAFERSEEMEAPTYQFTIGEEVAEPVSTSLEVAQALEAVRVVPNPYYGNSPYEAYQEDGAFVKITNLPAKCTVRIYNLAGQFVRQFSRNEQAISNSAEANPGILENQIYPALHWDLKNHKGNKVGSGVYLIHVAVPGLGEKVLKWMGKVPEDN